MDRLPQHMGVLQIELTDLCNLSCSMCAPHHEGWATVHGIPKGKMDFAVYEAIVGRLAAEDCRFDHIIFQWLGDPSLHSRLEDMLALAQERLGDRVGYLRVDTNAITLTPARMDRLVELYARHPQVPLLLVFTLDAATPETYRRVKGQDALERVRRNVRRLLMQRARLDLEDVRLNVELQFVLQEGNAHELGQFVRYWERTLACYGGKGHSDLMIKRLSVGAGGAGQQAADALYQRRVAEEGLRAFRSDHLELKLWESSPWEKAEPGPRQACPGLWLTPVIRHDGHLLMCCADLSSQMDLGPVHESGFRALWEGEQADGYRTAHLKGRFEELEACRDCGGIQWYDLPMTLVDATLERTGA